MFDINNSLNYKYYSLKFCAKCRNVILNNFILIKFLYLVKCLLLNKLCKLKLYKCEGLLAVALMVTSSSGFNGDIIITSQIAHSTISGRAREGGRGGGGG